MDPTLARKPTKRWQEAESYTYDGDDWGGYHDYNLPPQNPTQLSPQSSPPKPSGLRRRGQSLSSSGENAPTYYDAPTSVEHPPAQARPEPFVTPSQLPHQQPSQVQDPSPKIHNNQAQTTSSPSVASRIANFNRVATDSQRPVSPTRSDPSSATPDTTAQNPSRISYVEDAYIPQQAFRQPIRPLTDSPFPDASFPPRESSLTHATVSPGTEPSSNTAITSQLAAASATQTSTPNAFDESSSTRTFIRPADIYKRMEEEKEKERKSQESSRPSIESLERPTRHTPQMPHSRGNSGSPLRHVMNRSSPEIEYPQATPVFSQLTSSSQIRVDHNVIQSAPLLPKLDRFSGFDPNLWGSPESSICEGPYAPAASHPEILQHPTVDPSLNVPPESLPFDREQSFADISPIMKGIPAGFDSTSNTFQQQLPFGIPLDIRQAGVTEFSTGHARQISKESMSPSISSKQHQELASSLHTNSPARSPAFEKSTRLPQPAIAELGDTTPGTVEREEYGFPEKPLQVDSVHPIAVKTPPEAVSREHDVEGTHDMSSVIRDQVFGTTVGPLPFRLEQQSLQSATTITPPVHNLPRLATPRSSERSPSPSKSRVRHLANRYDEHSELKSPASSIASWASSNQRSASPDKEVMQTHDRPGIASHNQLLQQSKIQDGTDEANFRPKLPGEWISYSVPDANEKQYGGSKMEDVAEDTPIQDLGLHDPRAGDEGSSLHLRAKGQHKPLPIQLSSNSSLTKQITSSDLERLQSSVPPSQYLTPEDHSPEDLESDRLSKEIMRSLDPSAQSGTWQKTHSHIETQDISHSTDVASEISPAVDGMVGMQPQPDEGRSTSATMVESTTPHTFTTSAYMPSNLSATPAPSTVVTQRVPTTRSTAHISHRFSWENSEDLSQRGLSPNYSNSSPAHAATLFGFDPVVPVANTDGALHVASTKDDSPTPGAEMVAASANHDSQNPRNISGSSSKPIELPATNDSPTTFRDQETRPALTTTQTPLSFSSNIVPARTRNASAATRSRSESKLLGFQDILALKNPGERIQTYNATREQFAVMHTGLDEWVEYMLKTQPEFTRMIGDNSAAAAAQPTIANTSRFRQTSQSGSTNAKEKDVSQSASGKATSSMRGLLAKGRNKFRVASSDKVD